jgi:hypothetical protein
MATIKDVAKLAGVSFKTVSRVINRSPYVKDEVRQKVLRAPETLDYRPLHHARQMRTQPYSPGRLPEGGSSNHLPQNGVSRRSLRRWPGGRRPSAWLRLPGTRCTTGCPGPSKARLAEIRSQIPKPYFEGSRKSAFLAHALPA